MSNDEPPDEDNNADGRREDGDSHSDSNEQRHGDGNEAASPDPLQGSFQISHHTARLPESVGNGSFANALMVLSGQLEVILDFVQRLHEPNRVVARVVLSPIVARQFVDTLKHNVERYEETFGPLPRLPQPKQRSDNPDDIDEEFPSHVSNSPAPQSSSDVPGTTGGIVGAGINEPGTPKELPGIDEIYDDLRLEDDLLSGRYANAVVVRHSAAEFAFDFITRFVPHSAVSSRVIVAAPNVANMLQSLDASVTPK